MMPNILTIDEIQKRIQPVAIKYKLKKVSLFGSYARGEATPDSDVDLYIIKSKNSYKGIPWAAGAIYVDFEDALGKGVDLISPGQLKEDWDLIGTKLLYKNIKEDGVILYEQDIHQRNEYLGTDCEIL